MIRILYHHRILAQANTVANRSAGWQQLSKSDDIVVKAVKHIQTIVNQQDKQDGTPRPFTTELP